MNEAESTQQHWCRLAKQTRRKVNLAWWLDSLGPMLVAVGVLSFLGILGLRRFGHEVSTAQLLPWLMGSLVLLAALAWWRARRKFIPLSAAYTRLDSELRLHNALTVAQLGLAPWPALPMRVHDGWQWRWARLMTPAMVWVLCCCLALFLPVARATNLPLPPPEEPQSWQQMAEWLDDLKEEKIITPEAEEEGLDAIDQLRNQSEEKWFSHESLHASDTLQEQLRHDIASLSRNFSDMARALSALDEKAEQLSEAAKDQLLKEYSDSLEALKNSGLKLDPQMLKELSQMDPKNLQGLSKEQREQLKESLKQKSGKCEGMCEGFGQEKGFLGDGSEADGECKNPGSGTEPGKGGISRGPGTAPITLADEENDFGTEKREGVSSGDFSKAQMGELLELQNGKHEVEKTYKGPTAAGEARQPGGGGSQVWKESLSPGEKAILKRVFQ